MSSRRVAYLLCLVASATFVVGCSDDVKPPPADRGVDKPNVTDGPKTEGLTTDSGTDVIDCTGKADGTNCAAAGQTGMICLGGKCLATSCGDKYVDTANGEECDDGNTEAADGCNSCMFSCKASTECDDGATCNGAETCDTATHMCKLGTPANDGTACTQTGGGAGVCNGGVCTTAGCGNGVKDGAEECDDGNKVDGDGCDNSCKFSCHADTDCDDKNKCNGVETCKKEATKQACLAGTVLDCDDKKTCTTDMCLPNLGCLHFNIDKDADGHAMAPCGDDCNDNDPAIYGQGAAHHECADGKDNDCDGSTDEAPLSPGTCWADPDGDTYAATTAAKISNCTCPKGYTSRSPTGIFGQPDCQANNATVNPGQTGWFPKAYCTGLWAIMPPNPAKCLGTLSFDYDCDGKETQHWTIVTAGCKGFSINGKIICFGSGWSTTVPACGVQAKYTDCVADSTGKTCLKQEVLRTQECQ